MNVRAERDARIITLQARLFDHAGHVKALSLWQPWASLIALGVKTIETRSWSTKYRGPLAIHAAKRAPEAGSSIGDYRVTRARTPRDEPFRLWSHQIVNGRGGQHADVLPLGAVVATCELVDVVPIVGEMDPEHTLAESQMHSRHSGKWVGEYPHEGDLSHQLGGLWLIGCNALTHGAPTRVEDQRPYGDFTAGRFAWLLEKIEPLDPPVPAKGHQGLWNWDES